jgi:hypothetical protein
MRTHCLWPDSNLGHPTSNQTLSLAAHKYTERTRRVVVRLITETACSKTTDKTTTLPKLIKSNKMHQHADIYLLQNHSTCFGCPSHPSSGVHKSVTAASGTGHSIWATTVLQHGLNILLDFISLELRCTEPRILK